MSAPKIAAPIDTAAPIFAPVACSDCTCTVCSARRMRSCNAVIFGAYLSRTFVSAASRASRASVCRRIRKSRSDSSGADNNVARLLLNNSIDCVCAAHRAKSFCQVEKFFGFVAGEGSGANVAPAGAVFDRSLTLKSAGSASSQFTATAASLIGVTSVTSRVSSRPNFESANTRFGPTPSASAHNCRRPGQRTGRSRGRGSARYLQVPGGSWSSCGSWGS